MAFYRGQRGEENYTCKDNTDIIELFSQVWGDYDGSEAGLRQLVTTVLAYEVNWKRDLNAVPGLTDAVTASLSSILNDGMLETLKQTNA
jgi:tagaturonate reductase